MPPISKKPAAIKSAMKRVLKAYDYDPTDKLSLQDKAFAALQLIPTWNATLAYRAIYDPKNEKATDHKKLSYLRNQVDGMYAMKVLMAEIITGLKGDATVFPKKGKPQLDRELNAEADAFAKSEEASEKHRDLDSIMADSDKYTKEAILLELSQMAKETSDTGEKIKIFNAISALENMKSVASVDEENIVRYFLPLKCSMCSLHQQAINDGLIDADD